MLKYVMYLFYVYIECIYIHTVYIHFMLHVLLLKYVSCLKHQLRDEEKNI